MMFLVRVVKGYLRGEQVPRIERGEMKDVLGCIVADSLEAAAEKAGLVRWDLWGTNGFYVIQEEAARAERETKSLETVGISLFRICELPEIKGKLSPQKAWKAVW